MNADKRGFKHHNLTNRVIGVFYEVYNDLGQGFLESVYQEAMAVASPEGFGWSGEHGSVSSFVARWGGVSRRNRSPSEWPLPTKERLGRTLMPMKAGVKN